MGFLWQASPSTALVQFLPAPDGHQGLLDVFKNMIFQPVGILRPIMVFEQVSFVAERILVLANTPCP